MMTKNVVTIVCLTYNHVDYIEKALEGFLAQETDFPYKIVIHDDCSTDGTVELLKRYAERYPSQIDLVLEEENQTSQGIDFRYKIKERMEGGYVACCEGDDFWTDNKKLQRQFDFMQQNDDYSLVTHKAAVLDDRIGKIIGYLQPANIDRDFSTEEVIESAGWLWATNSMFMRAELFELPEVFKNWGVGDYPHSIFLSLCGKVRYLNTEMSVYRSMAKNSWTSNNETCPSIKIDSLKKRIAGLDGFDAYTQGRFEKSTSLVLGKWKCEIAVLENDWSKTKDRDSRRYLKRVSIKTRVSMWVHCRFPRLHLRIKQLVRK